MDSRDESAAKPKNDLSARNRNLAENVNPADRRRLLLAGLAATPVIISLMSRSAFAQTISCSLAASIYLGASPGAQSATQDPNQACQDAVDGTTPK